MASHRSMVAVQGSIALHLRPRRRRRDRALGAWGRFAAGMGCALLAALLVVQLVERVLLG
jgi:hypothetical protein